MLGSTVETIFAAVYKALRLWYFTHYLRGCGLGSSLCPFTPAFADEEVAALVVDNGDTAGVAGYDAPRAVPSTVACARRFPHVMLCSFCMVAAKLFGTMVGMDQRDSFHVHKPVVIPQVQFLDRLLRLLDEARSDSTGAILGQGDMPLVE